jgi:hypothetical protein
MQCSRLAAFRPTLLMCAFAFIGAGTRSGMSVLHPSNTIVDSSALVQTAWSQAWKEDVRNAFTGAADGGSLHGNLIADASGALYGTTSVVGSVRPCQQGCGVVFKLTPPSIAKTSWTLSVLHLFTGASGDGWGVPPAS